VCNWSKVTTDDGCGWEVKRKPTWRLTVSGELGGIEEATNAMTEYASPASVCCGEITREETSVSESEL